MEVIQLWQTTGIPTHHERAKLRLRPHEHVLRVTRLRRCGARPIAYEVSSIRLALVPNGYGAPAPCEIQDLAAANGVTLGRAHEVAATSSADTAIAKQLGVAARSAVTVLDRLVHTDTGLPIEWRMSYIKV